MPFRGTVTWSDRQLCLQACLTPFALPPGTMAVHLCHRTSPTRQILVEQLAGLRALTNFTLALNRLGSRVSKTQGKTEHTPLVHTSRIFSYWSTALFSVWFTVELVRLCLQLGTTEKENQTGLKKPELPPDSIKVSFCLVSLNSGKLSNHPGALF